MKFKQRTSYNIKDTVSKMINGRMVVQHNVAYRCERVLVAIASKGTEGICMKALVDMVNNRVHANYTQSDIQYAVRRLCNEKLVSNEDGVYCAHPKAIERWSKEPTEWV